MEIIVVGAVISFICTLLSIGCTHEKIYPPDQELLGEEIVYLEDWEYTSIVQRKNGKFYADSGWVQLLPSGRAIRTRNSPTYFLGIVDQFPLTWKPFYNCRPDLIEFYEQEESAGLSKENMHKHELLQRLKNGSDTDTQFGK